MPRRKYSDDRIADTAAMVRDELAATIAATRGITADDINAARSRLYARGRKPILARNDEFMIELADMICAM
jgi:hypothetical protein